jgi:hypothetical protein
MEVSFSSPFWSTSEKHRSDSGSNDISVILAPLVAYEQYLNPTSGCKGTALENESGRSRRSNSLP